MENTLRIICKAACDLFSNVYAMVSGFLMAIFGYLFPIFDILLFLTILFALDVFFGAWKSRKLNKQRFSWKIVWNTTFPRMAIAFVLIVCAKVWDSIATQTLVDTPKVIGLIFAGALMWSIAENGYYITKWFAFKVAAVKFGKIVKDETGMEIDDMKGEKV